MPTPRQTKTNLSRPKNEAKSKAKSKPNPISYRCLGLILGFLLCLCLGVYYTGTRLSKEVTFGDRLFLLVSSSLALSVYGVSRQSK